MSATYCFYVIFAVIIGTSWAQNDSDIANTLSRELEGKLDPKLISDAQNKSLSEIKARCEKNGGPDAYDKAQNASMELMQCISALVNVTKLHSEIEDAKPNGTVDEVFKRYCEKKPQFEVCFKDFMESSKHCLTTAEQPHLMTVYNVTQQLAEFICFKEGDRIALFIAEGGQECFQEKQDELKGCFKSVVGLGDELDFDAVSNVSLTFDKKQCHQLLELQTCVVHALESCPKPTSANIVESLFKFIRKGTPCHAYTPDKEVEPRSDKTETKSEYASSSPGLLVTSATVVTAFVVTLLV